MEKEPLTSVTVTKTKNNLGVYDPQAYLYDAAITQRTVAATRASQTHN